MKHGGVPLQYVLYIYDYILFILFINSNYLQLQRLLHNRIDLTVEELRKKPLIKKFKRVQRYKSTTSVPPVGTPNWCLNEQALKKFNRSINETPIYDHNTDQDDENDEYHNNTENNKYENKKEKIKKTKKKRQRNINIMTILLLGHSYKSAFIRIN